MCKFTQARFELAFSELAALFQNGRLVAIEANGANQRVRGQRVRYSAPKVGEIESKHLHVMLIRQDY